MRALYMRFFLSVRHSFAASTFLVFFATSVHAHSINESQHQQHIDKAIVALHPVFLSALSLAHFTGLHPPSTHLFLSPSSFHPTSPHLLALTHNVLLFGPARPQASGRC